MKGLLRRLSFRFKLLLAMMVVVAGVTGTTLYVTQTRMQAAYQKLFAERFTGQIAVFNSMQEARLASVKAKCLEMCQSVRLRAALEEGDMRVIYGNAQDELRDVLGDNVRQRRQLPRAILVRFIDAQGKELVPPAIAATGLGALADREKLKHQFELAGKSLATGPVQQVGYLSLEESVPVKGKMAERLKKVAADQKRPEVMEVIVTRIEDVDGEMLGALILGFPFVNNTERSLTDYSHIKSGMWLDGRMFSTSLAPADEVEINTNMRAMVEQKSKETEGTFNVEIAGEPHQVFFQLMNKDSKFPPTYQVSIYSMAEIISAQQDLRWRVVAFGTLVLLGGLLISLFLSHGFSAPIRDLVKATGEIQTGNFEVRVPVRSEDEVGKLAKSFNEMTAELALKEKYRAVLDMVADKDVAHQMVHGQMTLGGEKREVSVIFCDIRGFTAHTQGMDPAEVIKMLNEHMTALTKVVYEHNGVVDKFVGDLIMAVFGAPKSYGDDAYNATRCAVRMIEERNKLNETSEHKILVGIGIATGEAVAGCMGSADRLNYTVLGERVNLASRLCSTAGKMEVVIDEATQIKLGALLEVEELAPLKLKGFSDTVKAFKVTTVYSNKTNS